MKIKTLKIAIIILFSITALSQNSNSYNKKTPLYFASLPDDAIFELFDTKEDFILGSTSKVYWVMKNNIVLCMYYDNKDFPDFIIIFHENNDNKELYVKLEDDRFKKIFEYKLIKNHHIVYKVDTNNDSAYFLGMDEKEGVTAFSALFAASTLYFSTKG